MKKDTLVGPLDLYDLQGKTIVEVVVGCITFTVKKGKIPSKRYMPNFKIEAVGNKTMSLMVLDNYGVGDNGADEELLRHTDFGGALSNLVINTITGEIYSGSFCRNKGKLGLYFQSMPFNGNGHWPKVPPEFLPRLNELLTQKRPYHFEIDSKALHDLVIGWSGHSVLGEAITIMLDFEGEYYLQIGLDGQYRIVGAWKQPCP